MTPDLSPEAVLALYPPHADTIPTLLASRDRARLAALLPSLRLARTDWFSLWVYPLSGGFKSWSLLPDRAGQALLLLERKLEPALGWLCGFRLLTVMERV